MNTIANASPLLSRPPSSAFVAPQPASRKPATPRLVHGDLLNGLTYALLASCRSYLWLVSPFVRPSRRTLELLEQAVERGVKVAILCRLQEVDAATRQQLAQLGAVYVDIPTLHAKLVVTERGSLVWSGNRTKSSERRLMECGLFSPRGTTPHQDANAYCLSLARNTPVIRAEDLAANKVSR